jgi:short-subunit dehydrogenase
MFYEIQSTKMISYFFNNQSIHFEKPINLQMGKSAVVTGCSSGVGLSLAVLLAQNSYQVFATLRKKEDSENVLEALKKENVDESLVTFIIMDVASDSSVEEGFKEIYKKTEFVDVLICNAGYSVFGLCEYLPMEKMKDQFETNFYGVIRCVKQVLPSMRTKKQGRVQVVSSIGGLNGQVFNDIYCASKFAIEGLFETMAPVYSELGVHLSIVEPGAIATNFVQTAMKGFGENQTTKMDDDVSALLGKYMKVTQEKFSDPKIAQSGLDVAKVCLKAITDEKPSLRYQTNFHPIYTGNIGLKYSDPTGDKYLQSVKKNLFE